MPGKGRGRLLQVLTGDNTSLFPYYSSIERDRITRDTEQSGNKISPQGKHCHDDAFHPQQDDDYGDDGDDGDSNDIIISDSDQHQRCSRQSSNIVITVEEVEEEEEAAAVIVEENNRENSSKPSRKVISDLIETVAKLTSSSSSPSFLSPLPTSSVHKAKLISNNDDSRNCGNNVHNGAQDQVQSHTARTRAYGTMDVAYAEKLVNNPDFALQKHNLSQLRTRCKISPGYKGVLSQVESIRPPKPIYQRPPSPVQVAQLSRIESADEPSEKQVDGIRLLIGATYEPENSPSQKHKELIRRMMPPSFARFARAINFAQLTALSTVVHSTEPDLVEQPFASINRLYTCSSFSSELIHKFIQNLAKCNITDLTEVQKQVLPNMLTGSLDLVVNSPTGTGKTLSYIIALIKIIAYYRQTRKDKEEPHWPMALIIVPNKEIAYRIFTDLFTLSQGINVWIYYFYGSLNEAAAEDQKLLEKRPQIVICTPNRLVHFLEEKILDLSKIAYVILDNFDILLPNLGSKSHSKENEELAATESKLVKLLEECGQKSIHPRFFVFSTNIHGKLKSLAKRLVSEKHVMMLVGHRAKGDTQQTIYQVHHSQKKKQLLRKLQSLYRRYNRLVVFVGTAEMTEKVVAFLNMNAFFSGAYHPHMDQASRDQLMKAVKSNTIRILVSTFTMAQCMHLQGYCCVVNYDVPRKREEYLACIGRSGKLGTVAEAITFFNATARQDREMAPVLIDILTENQQFVPDFLRDYHLSKDM